eukprot:5199339-Ditylum_brightwellii.AAC.1
MKKQIDVLKLKAESCVQALAQGGACRSIASAHFSACLWQSISYPLPAMTMSSSKSTILEKALYNGTMAQLGLS